MVDRLYHQKEKQDHLYWERTHKYGIRIPKTVKEALKRIVEANAENESEEDVSPAKRAKVNIISMNNGVLEFEVCKFLSFLKIFIDVA